MAQTGPYWLFFELLNLIMYQYTKKMFKVLVEEKDDEGWHTRRFFEKEEAHTTTPKFDIIMD